MNASAYPNFRGGIRTFLTLAILFASIVFLACCWISTFDEIAGPWWKARNWLLSALVGLAIGSFWGTVVCFQPVKPRRRLIFRLLVLAGMGAGLLLYMNHHLAELMPEDGQAGWGRPGGRR